MISNIYIHNSIKSSIYYNYTIMDMKNNKPINGFTRPKHPFQIFTFIFFIQIMLCASIAIMPITNIII